MSEGRSAEPVLQSGITDLLAINDIAKVMSELREVVDWYSLGIYLKLTSSALDTVELDHRIVSKCRIKMVEQWLRGGPECSWRKLEEALRLMGEIAIAENIHKKYLSVTTPVLPEYLQNHYAFVGDTDTRALLVTKNKQRLKAKFSSLVTNLGQQLNKLNVNFISVQTYLTTFGSDNDNFVDEVQRQDTLPQLFKTISRYKIWDYLNFDLASYLIEQFAKGNQECLGLLKDYRQEFTGYLLTTKIIDHISAEREAETTTLKPPESISPENLCSKLTVKLAIDVTTHSLKYVDEVWKTLLLCSKLPKHTLLLWDIAESSLIITWLLPKKKSIELANDIYELQEKHFVKLQLKRVVLVTIDEMVIYMYDAKQSKTDIGRLLVSATLNGEASEVASLLDEGADVNCEDDHGYTALVAGCAIGFIEIVKLLMQRGADVNLRAKAQKQDESEFITPLYMALLLNHEEISLLLIDHGADVNGNTLEKTVGPVTLFSSHLYQAVITGLKSACKLLLEHGAEVDGESTLINDGKQLSYTPLMFAPNVEIAKLLLEYRANVNFQSTYGGQTALMVTSGFGRNDIAKLLLDHGAQVDLQDNVGRTALMYAVMEDDPREDKDRIGLARLLLQHGANPQLENEYGETALSLAVDQWDTELIELIANAAEASNISGTTQRVSKQQKREIAKQNPVAMIKAFGLAMRSRTPKSIF